METHETNRSARHAQIELARQVTSLVHGQQQMLSAELVTQYLTGGQPVSQADEAVLEVLRSEIPSVKITHDASILQTLIDVGLATSISEARRLVQGNAITLDGTKVTRESFQASDFRSGRVLIKKGKKFRDAALIELQ